jgi:hypothetical protein
MLVEAHHMITPSLPEGELTFWEYQHTHNLERVEVNEAP